MLGKEVLAALGATLQAEHPDMVAATEMVQDELVLYAHRSGIRELMLILRDTPRTLCKTLVDVCGVDYPERADRYEIVYHLLSYKHNMRIRVKVSASEETPVPSVVGIFHSAGWYEREIWDMYGVVFSDHPDLRRILTDYGFDGHPLRKDFPLTGHVEVRYDEIEKRVIYEPVTLRQEFRNFDFLNPWDGTDYVLPGDEKANPQKKAS